jgi:hypothetical protein
MLGLLFVVFSSISHHPQLRFLGQACVGHEKLAVNHRSKYKDTTVSLEGVNPGSYLHDLVKGILKEKPKSKNLNITKIINCFASRFRINE